MEGEMRVHRWFLTLLSLMVLAVAVLANEKVSCNPLTVYNSLMN